MNAIFQSFFTSFFIGFRRICLHAKVRHLVFIICSLLVGIDCVTDKLKATFSWRKNLKTGTPKNTENRMLRLWNFNIFWGRAHLDPTPPLSPQKRRTDGPLLIDSRLLYSNLQATSIIVETPGISSVLWAPFSLKTLLEENSPVQTRQIQQKVLKVLFGSKLLHIRRSLKHHDRSRPLLEHKDKHSNESWN